MTSMHRRWSQRVHIPVGTKYRSNSSVAECLNWYRGPPQEHSNQVGPCVTFHNDVRNTEPIGMDGDTRSRPETPLFYRTDLENPKPPTTGRQAWTTYTETTAQDYGLYRTAPLASHRYHVTTPGPQDNIHIAVNDRPPSQLIYDKYMNQNMGNTDSRISSTRYNTDSEESLRETLTNLQLQSYDRQIEFERMKLLEEREKELRNHRRYVATPTGNLNEKVLNQVLLDHAQENPLCVHTYDQRNGVVTSKPPAIPRPPNGARHNIGYPKTPHLAKYANDTNMHSSRPSSGVITTGRNFYNSDRHANCYQNFDKSLVTKRVNFQTPILSSRPGSSRGPRNFGDKSGHFFQWRDRTNEHGLADNINNDGLWKMPRFRSAQPRIDTRWHTDPYSKSTRIEADDGEKGKVKVNVECKEGDNMDVDVLVSKTPTTSHTAPVLRIL